MTPKKNKLSSLLALVLAVSSSPVLVQAIANGFPDSTNTFSNVGAVVAVGTDGQFKKKRGRILAAPTHASPKVKLLHPYVTVVKAYIKKPGN